MYSVAFREGLEVDPAREHWREAATRPLIWAAWYPSDDGHDPSHQQDRFPVILLSHGTGGLAQSLSWLASGLASQGYICLAVSHHGNTCVEPYMAEGFICWWERARDLSVLLDRLGAKAPFSGRLDLTRVSAVGFSLGGYSVLSLLGARTRYDLFRDWLASRKIPDSGPREFPDLALSLPRLQETSEKFRQSMDRQNLSYKDGRITAAVALAPPPPVRAFEPDSLKSITVPVGILVGQNDREAPHLDCACWLKQQNPAMELQLLGKTVGHYVFLPEGTASDKAREPELFYDPEGINRKEIHKQATDFVLKIIAR
ncbi:hypothetical protein O4H49_03430 [Kiloniella laminariae]|uniref:Dienelactone hydrolase n=1 Tax=Kiloniella laminariae TaxID=454162 RepID=A0ABT4LFE5_9PROT|nr:hypothetical protein [Kiloniella laminariae]MCZ4279814.1 hypothetical protein [Kiloniella laminariae]